MATRKDEEPVFTLDPVGPEIFPLVLISCGSVGPQTRSSRVQMSAVLSAAAGKEHGSGGISLVWNLALQDADTPPPVRHGQRRGNAAGIIPGLALPQHCSTSELEPAGRFCPPNLRHSTSKTLVAEGRPSDTDLQYTRTPTRTTRPTAARVETTASGRTAVLPPSATGPTLDWGLLLLTSEGEEERKSWTRDEDLTLTLTAGTGAANL